MLVTSKPTLYSIQKTKKRSIARNFLDDDSKKCKITVSPDTHLLYFLGQASIDKYSEELQGSHLPHANLCKAAYTNIWTHDKEKESFIPFKSLQTTLDIAHFPLTSHHRCRILIEDFMMLEKDEKIMCLISKKYPFMSYNHLKKRWVALIEDALTDDPYQPVQLQQTVFFPFVLTVVSNSSCNDFKDSNLTEDEVVHLCSESGGGSLTCHFIINGCNMLFNKFNNLIKHKDSIQFWKQSGPLSCYGMLWGALRKLSNCS